jgi:predicted SAM-dependent methyltransferase
LALRSLITRLKRVEHPVARDALLGGRAAIEYARTGHVVRRRRLRGYLRSTSEPKLHVGSGPVSLEGWLNTDIVSGDVYLDITRPLPFPDASFQYVFGEHVIEHISEEAGSALCAELWRVTAPDGVVRLTTPDLRKLIALYEDRNETISRVEYAKFLAGVTGKTYDQPCRLLNDYLRLWGHRYVYDEPDLTDKLRRAGFRKVERVESGHSEHAALREIERHGARFGALVWENQAEAMCLEATR